MMLLIVVLVSPFFVKHLDRILVIIERFREGLWRIFKKLCFCAFLGSLFRVRLIIVVRLFYKIRLFVSFGKLILNLEAFFIFFFIYIYMCLCVLFEILFLRYMCAFLYIDGFFLIFMSLIYIYICEFFFLNIYEICI